MKDSYPTKDLSEASFLYASGQKLVELKNDNGRVWFVFSDGSTCEKLSNSYWQKEAVVNAKEFSDALRTLKDIIFNKNIR